MAENPVNIDPGAPPIGLAGAVAPAAVLDRGGGGRRRRRRVRRARLWLRPGRLLRSTNGDWSNQRNKRLIRR